MFNQYKAQDPLKVEKQCLRGIRQKEDTIISYSILILIEEISIKAVEGARHKIKKNRLAVRRNTWMERDVLYCQNLECFV